MFAIDGVTLPSNASKARSGTRADFAKQADKQQADKLERAAQAMLARHRENDSLPVEADLSVKNAQRVARLNKQANQLRHWLTHHPEDRKGAKGSILKSNRTDNDSAKMATSNGLIQGCTRVAAVDEQYQIIVDAQANGTGSEQALLVPVVKALAPELRDYSLITADAGYHSNENAQKLAGMNVAALIADTGMRGHHERFKDQQVHKQKPHPLHDKGRKTKQAKAVKRYRPTNLRYDANAGACICPVGKTLYQNGSNCRHNAFIAVKFQGTKRDCVPCAQQRQMSAHSRQQADPTGLLLPR